VTNKSKYETDRNITNELGLVPCSVGRCCNAQKIQKGEFKMIDKLKENKGKIVGNAGALILGIVAAGILATALDERLGLSSVALLVYGTYASSKVAALLEKKVK